MFQIQKTTERGAVAVPAIMWLLGVPFTVVVLVWLLFFRG